MRNNRNVMVNLYIDIPVLACSMEDVSHMNLSFNGDSSNEFPVAQW